MSVTHPPLSIGFSPCPNDTFIFDAMIHRELDTQGLRFDCYLEDVETLNQWAFEGKLAITKLSYNTILQVADTYALIDAGSALGNGVGPLLLANEAIAPEDLADFLSRATIAIPGKHTTANLLFSLAFPEAKNKTEVLFSNIEGAVKSGAYDCGLVIHESRFTYQQKGLVKLMDMGDWWEANFGAAIPLGGIVVRRDIPLATTMLIEQLIRESLALSWKRYPALSDFVTQNAQEMEEKVMRQHIDLYVNEYTRSLGDAGRRAIQQLFEQATLQGIIAPSAASLFVS